MHMCRAHMWGSQGGVHSWLKGFQSLFQIVEDNFQISKIQNSKVEQVEQRKKEKKCMEIHISIKICATSMQDFLLSKYLLKSKGGFLKTNKNEKSKKVMRSPRMLYFFSTPTHIMWAPSQSSEDFCLPRKFKRKERSEVSLLYKQPYERSKACLRIVHQIGRASCRERVCQYV